MGTYATYTDMHLRRTDTVPLPIHRVIYIIVIFPSYHPVIPVVHPLSYHAISYYPVFLPYHPPHTCVHIYIYIYVHIFVFINHPLSAIDMFLFHVRY